jgi:carboxypeptidase C (cathepsin A)
MRKFAGRACLLLGVVLVTVGQVGKSLAGGDPAGQGPGRQKEAAQTAREGAKEAPAEPLAVTHHAITADGAPLHYTATAGRLLLRGESGKPEARVFFVAYVQDAQPASRRPIAFAFNGGPGAASVYLHLGGLGPKRVPLAEDGTALPAASKLSDNAATWLSFTDLVFVDPIGTGYSRAADGVDPQQFYDVEGDVRSLAEFIRLYVTRYDRWLSPKYLVGESYGSTRAAALASYLQSAKATNLDGLVLISSALSFQTFSFEAGNDLPYVLSLPSYTATALYHKKLDLPPSAGLPETLKAVQHWAMTEYLSALATGDTLPRDARQKIAGKLAGYTGLSERFIEDHNLRVTSRAFAGELLAREHRRLGLLDGRVVAAEVAGAGESGGPDPALFVVTGPWVAGLVNYLRQDLHYQTDLPYEYLSRKVSKSWKWGSAAGGYVNVSHDLAQAMTLNTHLRVFMAAGYYDLTTPVLSQKYTLDHLGLDPSLRDNVRYAVYRSGHQIYVSSRAMEKMKADVAAFLGGSDPRN